MAGLGALLAALVVVAFGVAIAAASSTTSLFDLHGRGENVLTEGFRQAASFTLAGAHVSIFEAGEASLRQTPALFALIPFFAVMIAVRAFVPRTRGMSNRARVLWGAAAGLPFGLLLLICGVIAGSAGHTTVLPAGITGTRGETKLELSLGAVFLLGTLIGALAGALGAWRGVKAERGPAPAAGNSPVERGWAIARAALRPLGIALLVLALAGIGVVVAQTIRGVGKRDTITIQAERSKLHATVENALYAAEHGVHLQELGGGASFHKAGLYGSLGMPVPATKVTKIAGAPAEGEGGATYESVIQPSGDYTVFSYRKGIPGWAFIVMLGLILVVVFFALYAGFAVARVARASAPLIGAAYGLLVGPIWALAMVILNALVTKDLFGRGAGDSVFVVNLLGGAVLGALGGLLGAQGARSSGPGPGSPPPQYAPPPPPGTPNPWAR
jgi:hypothetical protein